MCAVKTAAVSLMAWVFLCSPLCGPRQSDAQNQRDHGAPTLRDGSSIALLQVARLPGRSSLAPFAPWRSRIKSVLEESSHEIVDEIDFGPVAFPSQHSRSDSVDLTSHRLPTAPPLRC